MAALGCAGEALGDGKRWTRGLFLYKAFGSDLGPSWGILGPLGGILGHLGDLSVLRLLGLYFLTDFLGFHEKNSIRQTREKRFWYYRNSSFEPSRSFQSKLG